MNTRTIILWSIVILSTVKSFSQNGFNTERKDSTNVYHYSLIKYCDYLDKLKERPSVVYVEENFLITNDLPNKIRGYDLEYLNQLEVRKHLKGKKEMTIVRIVPLRVNGNDFFVNVIPFGVTYKKRNFSYINGGGLGVKFEYDKSIEGLRFKSSEMGGI